jgi:hypothetical protein
MQLQLFAVGHEHGGLGWETFGASGFTRSAKYLQQRSVKHQRFAVGRENAGLPSEFTSEIK